MIVIIFIIFLKLYRLFSLKPFKHKICFPLKPEIYFPYRVSILVHFRFFTFQEVNLLSSGNRVSVSVEPCRTMYLLTKWKGRMGKYLAPGHGVRTERSEVPAL